ncbi:hypothetical protein RQP53_00165 [Paucibacter sp. APW11]|uniref:ESPR domain-containing protein n=1 Tax=Roseateles aquae TaxID=3077235 RepID=A0ABU3P533_9BURK|nr:hypothetical protein [Paucibacter sp. APW11]
MKFAFRIVQAVKAMFAGLVSALPPGNLIDVSTKVAASAAAPRSRHPPLIVAAKPCRSSAPQSVARQTAHARVLTNTCRAETPASSCPMTTIFGKSKLAGERAALPSDSNNSN